MNIDKRHTVMKRDSNKELSHESGFTLTELMLAMVLFSTILVISTVGFIGMNRTFNRGTIKKQLSSAVQAFSDDITRTMRQQPTLSTPESCYSTDTDYDTCKNTLAPGWEWLSFTNACYFWQDLSVTDAVGGVYKNNRSCNPASLNEKTTLLSDRYVVRSKIVVSPLNTEDVDSGAELYSVAGVFTTREDDAVHIPDPTNPDDNWRCKGSAESSNVATCAVQQFNFIVNPRGNSL